MTIIRYYIFCLYCESYSQQWILINNLKKFQFESVSLPTSFIATICDEGKTQIYRVMKKIYIFLFVYFKKIDFLEGAGALRIFFI